MDKMKMIKTDCNCGFISSKLLYMKLSWSNLSITATLETEESDFCVELAVMGGRGGIQQLFLGSTTCLFCYDHVYPFP